MKYTLSLAALAAGVVLAAPAFADGVDKCTDEAKDKWMTEEQISAKAVELGYEVAKLKVEGSCYEVYAKKDGKEFEVFFNPVTAEVVLEQAED